MDGVVFEPIKQNVIKSAREKYGSFEGNMLLACYKLGLFNTHVSEKISEIVYRHTYNAEFMFGAKEALEVLAGAGRYVIEVCSKLAVGSYFTDARKAELIEKYKEMSPAMETIGTYNLLGQSESKYLYYKMAQYVSRDRTDLMYSKTYAVDDSIENLTPQFGINNIYISKDRKKCSDVMRMQPEIECFGSLADFVSHLNHQGRLKK